MKILEYFSKKNNNNLSYLANLMTQVILQKKTAKNDLFSKED